jgi:putative phosphoesterase
MSRILVISDIHGNYPALCAVARQAELERCDYIINCGDCTVYAPFANQVLNWLRAHKALSIIGNTDGKVVKLLKGKTFKKPGKAEKRIMYTHTFAGLDKENRKMLLAMKKKNSLSVEGQQIAFFHGSPAKHTEFLFPDTPDHRFQELAQICGADIILTGHSHTPYHKVVGNTHFINPGSVGRMFDGMPTTSHALLEVNGRDLAVRFFRCEYDVEQVVSGLEKAGLPGIYAAMYRLGRKLN